jgi:hypothetical protein
MKLDLEALCERHSRLLPEQAADYALHAAISLQEQGHRPGVRLVADLFLERREAELSWSTRPHGAREMLDQQNVTEFAAYAIALALVHATHGWSVQRRLQRFDYADWLLADVDGKDVALEVSGTVEQDERSRLRDKLLQVAKCVEAPTCVACVVRFREPAAWLRMVPEVLR